MLLNPRVGSIVQVWYRSGLRNGMPLHGCCGIVEIVSRGKPRNHGVKIMGKLYVVPCGNLRKVQDEIRREVVT